MQNKTSRLIKNASEISRSYQNFPRPKFFEVTAFTTTPSSIMHEMFGMLTVSGLYNSTGYCNQY